MMKTLRVILKIMFTGENMALFMKPQNMNSDVSILAPNIKRCQALYDLGKILGIQAFMKVICPNYPKFIYRPFFDSSELTREESRENRITKGGKKLCDMCDYEHLK